MSVRSAMARHRCCLPVPLPSRNAALVPLGTAGLIAPRAADAACTVHGRARARARCIGGTTARGRALCHHRRGGADALLVLWLVARRQPPSERLRIRPAGRPTSLPASARWGELQPRAYPAPWFRQLHPHPPDTPLGERLTPHAPRAPTVLLLQPGGPGAEPLTPCTLRTPPPLPRPSACAWDRAAAAMPSGERRAALAPPPKCEYAEAAATALGCVRGGARLPRLCG